MPISKIKYGYKLINMEVIFMSKMSSKERFITALKGGVPDRVPVCPNLTRWVRGNEGCSCIRHLYRAQKRFGFDSFLPFYQYIWQSVSNDYVYSPSGGYNYSVNGVFGDISEVDVELRVSNKKEWVMYDRKFTTPAGELRDVIRWARPDVGYGDGPNPHREEPLVKSLKDLDALKYLYPEPRKDLLAEIPIIIEDLGDDAVLAAMDAVHFGSWGTEVFLPEQMLIASIDEPKLLEGVCRIQNDAHLRNIKSMLDMGLGVVMDSWFQCSMSTGWSKKTYRETFLPLIKEVVDLTHSYGGIYIYQDDGRMKEALEPLVDVGVDCISGLQPAEGGGDVILSEVKKMYGDKASLMGGIDPCYTFDLGSVETVKSAAIKAINDAAQGGGYILATGEAMSPTVPEKLIYEFAKTAKEFGTY